MSEILKLHELFFHDQTEEAAILLDNCQGTGLSLGKEQAFRFNPEGRVFAT